MKVNVYMVEGKDGSILGYVRLHPECVTDFLKYNQYAKKVIEYKRDCFGDCIVCFGCRKI